VEDPGSNAPDDPLFPGIEEHFITAPDIPSVLEAIGPLGRESRLLPTGERKFSHHWMDGQQILQGDGEHLLHFRMIQTERGLGRKDPGKGIDQGPGIAVKIVQRPQHLDLILRDSQFFPGFPKGCGAETGIRFLPVASGKTDVSRLPFHGGGPDLKEDFPPVPCPPQGQQHSTFPQTQGPVHPLPLVLPKPGQQPALFQFLTHRGFLPSFLYRT